MKLKDLRYFLRSPRREAFARSRTTAWRNEPSATDPKSGGRMRRATVRSPRCLNPDPSAGTSLRAPPASLPDRSARCTECATGLRRAAPLLRCLQIDPGGRAEGSRIAPRSGEDGKRPEIILIENI